MTIPKNIKIGGHSVEVVFRTSKEITGNGDYDIYHQLIRLRKEENTPLDAIEESFLHEILEAIRHFNNLQLSHGDLTVISEGLFQVLTDNKLRFDK